MPPKGSTPWAAFQYRIFTIVWIATVLSNTGTWMYSATAGWLMTNLTRDAFLVSLVQVANTVPMFLFAMVAGALSDVVDKRRFLLAGEIGTTALSAIFAALVWFNEVTPASLLSSRFLFDRAAGAITAPAWQAVVPEARSERKPSPLPSRPIAPASTSAVLSGRQSPARSSGRSASRCPSSSTP